MDLETLVLDRLIELYACIVDRKDAKEHLNAMTNSEFLCVLSEALKNEA